MSKYIEFKNVKKVYKMGEVNIEALSGVNFSVDKGEFVVVAGASGAGKSTILNILGGMDSPTSGEIIVDGKYINDYSNKELITYRRYDIGFVFQFYNLVQNLTAKENVELATQICKDPLNIDEIMEAVGLQDRKNNFPAQLSGGEQQRVAIARALAKNPKILLCDEPTGALDSKSSRLLLDSFEKLNKDLQATILMVTHDAFTASYAHRILFIKDGKVFNELVRGNDTRREFFNRIIEVVTLLGGDVENVF